MNPHTSRPYLFVSLVATVALSACGFVLISEAAVHWGGPGGDIWNTNSSPYFVDPLYPLDVKWSSLSSEGQFDRPSGLVLADVGIAQVPYLFGTTGHYGNSAYRRLANNGTQGSWQTQSGRNDSGTGFRLALSLDGSIVYHIDDGSQIRAYPTGSDPAGTPLWSTTGNSTSPGLDRMIKVGPDGRVYGHYQGTAALDPVTGHIAWQSAADPEGARYPGAFLNNGSQNLYVVAGVNRSISAYDIASPSGSQPVWSYLDIEGGFSGPTIDPATGSIYVFRHTRVIKLNATGQLLWESEPVDAGDLGRRYPALSRDGQTLYYQTEGDPNAGDLYAFRTVDGAIRWRYPTGGADGLDNIRAGPVVSANGLVLVANGALTPYDNRVFCLKDEEANAVEVDSFDLNDTRESGAPWITIGPGGVVYLDGWAYPQEIGPRLFAFAPGQPAINVQPGVALGRVTVGDTVLAVLPIMSVGNAPLTIKAMVSSAPGVTVEFLGQSAPFLVAPGDTAWAVVRFTPDPASAGPGSVSIETNDPLRPLAPVSLSAEVLALRVTSRIPSSSEKLPLGEAATVIVTPGSFVKVERAIVFFRPSGEAAFTDSIDMGRAEGDSEFVAQIRGEKVTEAGIEYYVRVENSGYIALDPADGPERPRSRGVTSPVGFTTAAVPDDGGRYAEGRDTPIFATLPRGASYQGGTLFYRAGGAAAYDSVGLEMLEVVPGTILPGATVPGSSVGARGIEYWVRVQTLTRPIDDPMTDPPMAPVLFPKVQRTDVNVLLEPREHVGGRYRMVSVPLDLELLPDATPEALLSDQPEFGSYDPVRWRCFRYVGPGPYAEINSTAADSGALRPVPGRAFWLINREPHRINTAPVSGRSVATGTAYRVRLEKGWNQVGNPFLFTLSWSQVRAEGPGGAAVNLEPPIAWDPLLGKEGAYSEVDVFDLIPFEGYWVKNPEEHPVELVFPAQEAPSPLTECAPSASPRDSTVWRLRIAAHRDGAVDRHNAAAVDRSGRDGPDALDRSEPPLSPGPGISLYFMPPGTGANNSSGRLRVDARAPIPADGAPVERGRRWSFDVAVAGDDHEPFEVGLEFDGVSEVPAEFQLRLIDRTSGQAIDLRTRKGYSFVARPTTGESLGPRFELRVGSRAFVEASQDAQAQLPKLTRLLPSFPNPAQGTSVVSFELARSGPVRIEIFDLAGRRVRVLLDEVREAGRHELAWRGDAESGRPSPSGIYSLRMMGPGHIETRKVVRLP